MHHLCKFISIGLRTGRHLSQLNRCAWKYMYVTIQLRVINIEGYSFSMIDVIHDFASPFVI